MALANWLHRDGHTLTVVADLVLVVFVLLAAGAALYDIGTWIGLW
jgi:hypothetical protein